MKLVPHEVMAAVVGGMVRYAAPHLSDTVAEIVRLNAAIKIAALQFENLPKDLSNIVVQYGKGLKLADIRVLCRDSVVATIAQLTHHRSAVVKGELQALLDNLHAQHGVRGQFLVPSTAFASHTGDTWIDCVLRAMGTLGVGLLMLSSVYSCAHAHLPQVQWAGLRWATRSYTFNGRDVCVLSGPRTEEAVRSLTDPANDLLHASLPCHVPGHWAARLRDCDEDHLHLPATGVGPTMLGHVWLTGLQALFQSRLPSLPTHRLLHPVRHKKATKRTRQSATGDAYVLGGYRDNNGNPECPRLSMPFAPPASLMVLPGDVLDGHRRQEDPALVPLLTPHAGGGIELPPLWVVHGVSAFDRACAAVWGRAEWAIVLLVPAAGPCCG